MHCMASSDNFPILEQWMGRPNFFPEARLSEAYALDTDILTKALQMSFSKDSNPNTDTILFNYSSPCLVTTPLLPTTKPQLGIKRKSRRASKRRPPTTYITADVANFRELVQQVTGFKLGNSPAPVVPLLKPERRRSGCRFTGPVCLPTLDTSAFLLEQHGRSGPDCDAMFTGSGRIDGPDLDFSFDAFTNLD